MALATFALVEALVGAGEALFVDTPDLALKPIGSRTTTAVTHVSYRVER